VIVTLKLVTSDEGQPPDAAPPPPEQPGPRAIPWRLIVSTLAFVALALVVTGYVVLSQQAAGFELTLQFGKRVTRVTGTRVRLEQPGDVRTCVLSLLDFRAVREKSLQLEHAEPLEKPKGEPTFSLSAENVVNTGALPKAQLEELDAFIINRASACLKGDQ
jgi:hypothetical protein